MISLKTIFYIAIMAFGWVVLSSEMASASPSLQVKPLLINEKLKPAETKKGYIDVANPTAATVTIQTSIEGFRQIDDQGNLEFFKSKEIAAGITPDLEEFELGPREALRMYYLVEGKKLPPGDVFGAIFFSIKNDRASGVNDSARVGTLIVLENGTPGSRVVDVDMSRISPIQLGETVAGGFRLHNPANPETTSGFFPDLKLRMTPLVYEKKINGPLLMAGNSRLVEFSLPSNRIGVYKFEVQAGDTKASKWMLIVTGWWRWLLLFLLTFGLIILVFLKYQKRSRRRGLKKRK